MPLTAKFIPPILPLTAKFERAKTPLTAKFALFASRFCLAGILSCRNFFGNLHNLTEYPSAFHGILLNFAD